MIDAAKKTPHLPHATTQQHAMMHAVADLYHAFFTGSVLAAIGRRGPEAAARLVFAVFRRQQKERFLPGLKKLGIADLPHAVACAQYHYLSNKIGGVSVEYMYESDRKAWIRYAPPRWLWWGTAICAIPGEVSRAMLLGWHAYNGVSLGNRRVGFVCTKQGADGQDGLEGYYYEHDRDLELDERLRFSRTEEAPDFDPAFAPWIPVAEWPEERLRKAHRSYAMEYVRTAIIAAVEVFGPGEATALLGMTGRLVGMQFYHHIAASAGVTNDSPEAFVDWMTAVAQAQGDIVAPPVESHSDHARFTQTSWALMSGVADLPDAAFHIWTCIWSGALAAHNRRLELIPEKRLDLGDGRFEWSVRSKRKIITP